MTVKDCVVDAFWPEVPVPLVTVSVAVYVKVSCPA